MLLQGIERGLGKRADIVGVVVPPSGAVIDKLPSIHDWFEDGDETPNAHGAADATGQAVQKVPSMFSDPGQGTLLSAPGAAQNHTAQSPFSAVKPQPAGAKKTNFTIEPGLTHKKRSSVTETAVQRARRLKGELEMAVEAAAIAVDAGNVQAHLIAAAANDASGAELRRLINTGAASALLEAFRLNDVLPYAYKTDVVNILDAMAGFEQNFRQQPYFLTPACSGAFYASLAMTPAETLEDAQTAMLCSKAIEQLSAADLYADPSFVKMAVEQILPAVACLFLTHPTSRCIQDIACEVTAVLLKNSVACSIACLEQGIVRHLTKNVRGRVSSDRAGFLHQRPQKLKNKSALLKRVLKTSLENNYLPYCYALPADVTGHSGAGENYDSSEGSDGGSESSGDESEADKANAAGNRAIRRAWSTVAAETSSDQALQEDFSDDDDHEFKQRPKFLRSMMPVWTVVASLGGARSQHTALVLPGGETFVIGGRNGNAEAAVASTELHGSDGWRPGPSMAIARADHAAALLADLVFVTGGIDSDGKVLKSTEIFDPTADAWRSGPDLAVTRHAHSVALLGNGEIIVAGGSSTPSDVLKTTEIYSPKTNMWRAGPDMTIARQCFVAVTLQTGHVLVVGGSDGEGTLLSSTELLDVNVVSDGWKIETMLSTPRRNHAAAVFHTGDVVILGGEGRANSTEPTTEIYSSNSKRWREGPKMMTARSSLAAVVTPNGDILAIGGIEESDPKAASSRTELLDHKTCKHIIHNYAGKALGQVKRHAKAGELFSKSGGTHHGEMPFVEEPYPGFLQAAFALLDEVNAHNDVLKSDLPDGHNGAGWCPTRPLHVGPSPPLSEEMVGSWKEHISRYSFGRFSIDDAATEAILHIKDAMEGTSQLTVEGAGTSAFNGMYRRQNVGDEGHWYLKYGQEFTGSGSSLVLHMLFKADELWFLQAFGSNSPAQDYYQSPCADSDLEHPPPVIGWTSHGATASPAPTVRPITLTVNKSLLLEHGYVDAMCNLIAVWGVCSKPTTNWRRPDYEHGIAPDSVGFEGEGLGDDPAESFWRRTVVQPALDTLQVLLRAESEPHQELSQSPFEALFTCLAEPLNRDRLSFMLDAGVLEVIVGALAFDDAEDVAGQALVTVLADDVMPALASLVQQADAVVVEAVLHLLAKLASAKIAGFTPIMVESGLFQHLCTTMNDDLAKNHAHSFSAFLCASVVSCPVELLPPMVSQGCLRAFYACTWYSADDMAKASITRLRADQARPDWICSGRHDSDQS